MNQLFRRLRHYEVEAEWISALLDSASRFAKHVAIFSLQNDVAHLRAQANLHLPENLSFPLSSAAAFSGAVETRDPVIALRNPSEVTEALAGADTTDRCHVVPIINGPRTAAVLFVADQEYVDVNALELIASLASAVLERHANTSLHAQIASLKKPGPEPESPQSEVAAEQEQHAAPELETAKEETPREPEPAQAEAAPVQGAGADTSIVPELQQPELLPESTAITGGEPSPVEASPPVPAEPPPANIQPAPAAAAALPAWADLSERERTLHLRAQRFARVAVAEMQLAKPLGSRAGREQSNLYMFLKPEIDKARESYRKQFMTIPSMVDYLHLELVNAAAEGDERKLGAEYPGQLL
ncbi:MAG: hypothetical protein JO051_09165 [Acidobacteriaceae bacterium]|nr:hypothetical protein [Acidobacteriaceae bacterium]